MLQGCLIVVMVDGRQLIPAELISKKVTTTYSRRKINCLRSLHYELCNRSLKRRSGHSLWRDGIRNHFLSFCCFLGGAYFVLSSECNTRAGHDDFFCLQRIFYLFVVKASVLNKFVRLF